MPSPSRVSHPVVRVWERVCLSSLCWGYISCSLHFHLWCDCQNASRSPVSLSVRHLPVILQHCARLRDGNSDQEGQTVTINYTRAVAAITLPLMPVTWCPFPKVSLQWTVDALHFYLTVLIQSFLFYCNVYIIVKQLLQHNFFLILSIMIWLDHSTHFSPPNVFSIELMIIFLLNYLPSLYYIFVTVCDYTVCMHFL